MTRDATYVPQSQNSTGPLGSGHGAGQNKAATLSTPSLVFSFLPRRSPVASPPLPLLLFWYVVLGLWACLEVSRELSLPLKQHMIQRLPALQLLTVTSWFHSSLTSTP